MREEHKYKGGEMNFTAGLYSKNPETPIQNNLCTPMFIEAQFTIASAGSNLNAHQ